MWEIFLAAVFWASLTGLTVIFWKKLPEIKGLPKTTPARAMEKRFLIGALAMAKAKVANLPWLKDFSFDEFWQKSLQKLLSKFRVLALKIESQTGSWLAILRQKSQANGQPKKEEAAAQDNFWQELQKKKE
jgi:hypothetical protein